MRRSALRRAPAVLAVAAALLLTACGTEGGGGTDGEEQGADAGSSTDDGGPTPEAASEELSVVIASYDVAVGEDRRLLAGVLTADAAQLAFGEVTFELGYLGDEPAGEAELTGEATARYLPVLGLEPEADPTERPQVLVGQGGTGVYEGFVDLEEPGFYGLRVSAELEDGTTRQGRTTFQVLPEPEVPDIGDEAPRSRNLTIADVEAGDALPVAVDSRAQGEDDEVPDHHLHDTTVADALDDGRPVVAILSTPTYCVSAFCGPLTVEFARLAEEREDDAAFIHIEVWRDFEARELNEAAAEWIQTEAGGNEPWVFLVDGDGIVQGRWDNVVDVADLERRLDAL
jgi:predicted small secreted protein